MVGSNESQAIYLFDKHLVNAHDVPSTVLYPRDITESHPSRSSQTNEQDKCIQYKRQMHNTTTLDRYTGHNGSTKEELIQLNSGNQVLTRVKLVTEVIS